MAKLRIDRKRHPRKGYYRRGKWIRKSNVKRSVYYAKDRGARGRGPKIIKITKPGSLGGEGFFSLPTETRHRRELTLARRVGEMQVMGKLSAIGVLNKRTNPTLSKKAFADRRYVAKSIGGYRGK